MKRIKRLWEDGWVCGLQAYGLMYRDVVSNQGRGVCLIVV